MFLISKIHNHTISEKEIHLIFFITVITFKKTRQSIFILSRTATKLCQQYHESSEDRLTISDTWRTDCGWYKANGRAPSDPSPGADTELASARNRDLAAEYILSNREWHATKASLMQWPRG